jgi:hypothetical protein
MYVSLLYILRSIQVFLFLSVKELKARAIMVQCTVFSSLFFCTNSAILLLYFCAKVNCAFMSLATGFGEGVFKPRLGKKGT